MEGVGDGGLGGFGEVRDGEEGSGGVEWHGGGEHAGEAFREDGGDGEVFEEDEAEIGEAWDDGVEAEDEADGGEEGPAAVFGDGSC